MADTMRERRHREVLVSGEFFLHLLAGPWRADGRGYILRQPGIPEGTTTVSVSYREHRDEWRFVLHHPSWPVVPDGAETPGHPVAFEEFFHEREGCRADTLAHERRENELLRRVFTADLCGERAAIDEAYRLGLRDGAALLRPAVGPDCTVLWILETLEAAADGMDSAFLDIVAAALAGTRTAIEFAVAELSGVPGPEAASVRERLMREIRARDWGGDGEDGDEAQAGGAMQPVAPADGGYTVPPGMRAEMLLNGLGAPAAGDDDAPRLDGGTPLTAQSVREMMDALSRHNPPA